MIRTTHSGQPRGARERVRAAPRSVSALRRAALAAGHGCVGGIEAEEAPAGLRASPALAGAALACALTAALAAAAFVVR